VNLQSLDLSNNQLRALPSDIFSANAKLSALHLSKNPLEELQSNLFGNLSSLKVLSLSYLSSVNLTVADDLLKPTTSLQRLDVDNSPLLARSLLRSNQFDHLQSLQELGLLNSDLRSLPVNWPVLSRITELRLSSSQWHCDENFKWFRDWLLNPDNSRKFDHIPQDIRCATPDTVQGRALVSLTDSQFQPAEQLLPMPKTVTSGLVSTTQLPQSTVSADFQTTRVTEEKHSEPTIEFYEEEKGDEGEVDEEEAAAGDDDDFYDDVNHIDPSEDEEETDDINHIDPSENEKETDDNKASSTVSNADHTVVADALNYTEEDTDLDKLKVQIIIAGSTVGATLLVITIIVAAIVHVCRHHKRPLASTSPHETGRTFIKYENKNGVLYFSTPAESMDSCPEVDQRVIVSHVQTVVDKKGPDDSLHYLVPAVSSTPATPLTPSSYNKTMVYRLEVF